jgi:hypothetical protein
MGNARFGSGVRNRAVLVALLVALLFVAGAVYKWVDEQGRTHYSDTPPAGREYEVVTTSPGPSAEQQAEARQRAQVTQESVQIDAARREAARAEQQSAQRSQEAGAELAVQVCADAQVQRMTLDLQTPVYRRVPGGERMFLADPERPAEKRRLDDVIARYCSDDPSARAAQRQRFLELSLGRRPPCVEVRDALVELKTRPARESAEAIERLTGQIKAWHCYPVPVEGVWLALNDYTMRAPPER